jgi:hypothetical protein
MLEAYLGGFFLMLGDIHWRCWYMLEAYLGVLVYYLRHILEVFGTWFDAYLGDFGYMIWGIFLDALV